MNKERILELADLIENQAFADEGVGFNMSYYYLTNSSGLEVKDYAGHPCGTAACIAGHAWLAAQRGTDGHVHTLDKIIGPRGETEYEAKKYLGLNWRVAEELFIPECLGDHPTPAEAARTLRHLAATGNVDWYEHNPRLADLMQKRYA